MSYAWVSVDVKLVKSDLGNNKFLTVSRELMCYDDHLGPYDALNLIVTVDGSYRLLVCDKTLEENVISPPI